MDTTPVKWLPKYGTLPPVFEYDLTQFVESLSWSINCTLKRTWITCWSQSQMLLQATGKWLCFANDNLLPRLLLVWAQSMHTIPVLTVE